MGIVLKNNAHTTLAANISSTDTTIQVSSVASFPSLDVDEYFYCTIESTTGAYEIVKVTQVNAASFNVVRAQEDTIAVPFNIGARVELRVTVQSITDQTTVAITDVIGTIATQDANNVTITGGTISGTSLLVTASGAATQRALATRFSDTLNVLDWGVVGDGATDNTTALAAIVTYLNSLGVGQRPEVIFPKGIYVYTTSPNWAIIGIRVRFEGDVRLRCTGTGNCFDIDAGAAGYAWGMSFLGWPLIEGAASTVDGVYIRSAQHATFEFNVRGCSAKAFNVEFAVLCVFNKPVVSNNQGAFYGATPTHGMYFTRRGSGADHSGHNMIINPILEGIPIGAYEDYCVGNTYVGGALEGCTNTGFIATANSREVTMYGPDYEVNTTMDMDLSCDGGEFYGLHLEDLITLRSGATNNKFFGGDFGTITVAAGANYNKFVKCGYNRYGTGSFNNSGTGTEYDLWNITASTRIQSDLVSPAFTGNPTAPTASPGDNDTTIATTAFVTDALATGLATKANTSHTHAQSDITNLTTDLAAKAPLASPTFTGSPAAPTPTQGDNDTSIATTAFVTTAVGVVRSRGQLFGCVLSNNASDATNDIDITAGNCADSTNTALITVAAMTKRLDANWAAGTNQGFRYSGAAIADTTYHIYVAATAAGVQDFYADPSATVATALGHLQAESGGSSYIYLRRIGSIIRSSGAIVAFVQNGDYFAIAPRFEFSGGIGGPTGARTNYTLARAPLGIVVEADLTVALTDATPAAATYVGVTWPNQAGFTPAVTQHSFMIPAAGATVPQSGSSRARVLTNTSGQVAVEIVGTTADHTLYGCMHGWVDSRGQYA